MNRRQLLQRIVMLLGGAVSRPLVAAVLAESPTAAADAGWEPVSLSPHQDRLVSEIAERIIPATDTPGASDAGVDRFVDLMLTHWYDAADRKRFTSGLDALEATSRETFARPFLKLSADEQISLLQPLDIQGVEARIEAARDVGSFEVDRLPFFAMMKEMTLVGYYTSKVGMLEELDHEGFTGTFEPCAPLPNVI